jgi:hypothetical protein
MTLLGGRLPKSQHADVRFEGQSSGLLMLCSAKIIYELK